MKPHHSNCLHDGDQLSDEEGELAHFFKKQFVIKHKLRTPKRICVLGVCFTSRSTKRTRSTSASTVNDFKPRGLTRIHVLDANLNPVLTLQDHVRPGEYDLRRVLRSIDRAKRVKLEEVSRFYLVSNPEADLRNAKFKLHYEPSIFNLHIIAQPSHDPAQDLQTEQSNTAKILNEEKKINLIPYDLALPENDEDDMAQSVPVSEKNKTSTNTSSNLNNNNTYTQNRSNDADASDEELSDQLTTVLSKIDLRFVERFPNSNEDSLVMKALTSDSTPVVVKLYTRQDDYENEKKIYEWLESASFENKPKLIRSFETKGMRGLVLEYIPQHQLNINSEHDLLSFTVALLKTVEKLHACDVIHGDIKRSNLIYDSERTEVKLLDFGLSEILPKGSDYTHRRGQTPGFLRYYYQPMTFRDDLCNIGVVLCQLIYGVDPMEVGYDELLEMTKYGIAKTLFPVSDEVIWFTNAMLDVTQGYDASYALQESLFSDFVQTESDDN